MLGETVRAALEAAAGAPVAQAAPVGGGCISPSFRVLLADGTLLFVKTQPDDGPAGLMQAEALSLLRLAAAGAVRVPALRAAGDGWLALEWLEPRPGDDDDWRQLGASLARLHRRSAGAYGWERDNFIGTLPQANGVMASWPEFWVERRLRPQLDLAERHLGAAACADFAELFNEAGAVLAGAEADGPSLLHGDLWHGNVHMSTAGPALVDPACSHGHREVDLAMAALFGGFPPAFQAGYEEEWPLLPGASGRRAVYQLYYLLVHVNLFGGGYVAQTVSALRSALSHPGRPGRPSRGQP